MAAIDRAEDVARAARAAGDPRPLDVLRADFLTDTAIFGWPEHDGPLAGGRPAASDAQDGGRVPRGARGCGGSTFVPLLGRRPAGRVWIVVPFTTAAGADNTPCELPGHGWVTAEHARQII